MKTKIDHKSKTPYIIISLVVAIICFIVAIYFIAIKGNNTSPDQPQKSEKTEDINYDPPTKDQVSSGENRKTPESTPDPKTTSTLSVSITSIVSNSELLQIRAIIYGAISNDGVCRLTLSKDDSDDIVKKSNTNALPSSTTCHGFDIDRNELSKGKWDIKLYVTIEDQTSTASSEVMLE